jgi:hypothetical protein
MKRFIYISAFFLLSLAVSCEVEETPVVRVPAEIKIFRLGYVEDTSDVDGRFSDEEDKHNTLNSSSFIAFNDEATLKDMVEKSDKNRLEGLSTLGVEAKPSEYLYNEGGYFQVKTTPNNAMIKSMNVSVDNDSVLVIKRVSEDKIYVQCIGLGDVTVKVKVNGAYNSVENSFPIRVVDRCHVDFYITPYWLGNERHDLIQTCLRFRMKTLPAGMSSLPLVFKDSVEVIGNAAYLDLDPVRNKLVSKVRNDTIRYPAETHYCLGKAKRKNFIRNISEAIHLFWNHGYVKGYDIEFIENNETGEVERIPVPCEYPYTAVTVIMHFNIYGTDPNIQYSFGSTCKKSFKVKEEDGFSIVDCESDKDEEDDDEYTYPETQVDSTGKPVVVRKPALSLEVNFSESEKPYFSVTLCYFGRDEDERQQDMDKFKEKLRDSGVTDNMTDEKKDSVMTNIDNHKKEGE